MERHHFEAELQALRNQLLTMGGLVEERVHRAVQALVHRREEDAHRIIATDKEINDLQMEIDGRCLKLLATQTPLAVDLRLITSAMKINADLERVGDQAVNIAESVIVLLPQPPLKPLIDIPRMAAIAEKMIRDALDAFVKKDAGLALGDAVAARLVASRATDNWLAPNPPYVPGTGPGEYQLTPPGYAAPINAGAASWVPFAMTSAGQFRSNGPPPLRSRRYARNVEEVAMLGAVDSIVRTPEQVEERLKLGDFFIKKIMEKGVDL